MAAPHLETRVSFESATNLTQPPTYRAVPRAREAVHASGGAYTLYSAPPLFMRVFSFDACAFGDSARSGGGSKCAARRDKAPGLDVNSSRRPCVATHSCAHGQPRSVARRASRACALSFDIYLFFVLHWPVSRGWHTTTGKGQRAELPRYKDKDVAHPRGKACRILYTLSLSIFFVAWCHRVEVAVAFCCYTTFLHNLLAIRFTSTCWPSSRQFTPFIRTVMPAITRSAARAGSSSARAEEAKPYYAPRRQRHCSVPRTGDVVALRLDPALSVSHLGWDECTHAMERMETRYHLAFVAKVRPRFLHKSRQNQALTNASLEDRQTQRAQTHAHLCRCFPGRAT